MESWKGDISWKSQNKCVLQGKSPSQQLGELHQRRNELIAQLTKTKTVEDAMKEIESPTGTYPPVAQVMPRVIPNHDQNSAKRAPTMAKSVADSMATTLTTMSIVKPNREHFFGTMIFFSLQPYDLKYFKRKHKASCS